MATKTTGWLVECTAAIASETDTSVTIKVTSYWKNNGWDYDINNVSSWVYCGSSSHQVKNAGSIDSTGVGNYGKVSCGSYTFTVNKTTSSQSIKCYAKITSNSSYVSGTKSSSTVSITVPAKTSYAVTYNANGGSGAPSKQTKYYGTNLTLSSTKPTRTGYSFQGWGTSATDTTVDYAAGATYSKNAAITLYAIWKANTYTVKFNANGGSGAPANQTKTYGVNLTLSKTVPTRTNYNFKGWGTSMTATSVSYSPGGSYTKNAAITLYAIWELAYVKPRINNVVIDRCDADGTLNEEGVYAHIECDWETDLEIVELSITTKTTSGDDVTDTVSAEVSGTSGHLSIMVGSNLNSELSYDVKITVTDSSGSSYYNGIIPTMALTIDAKKGGKGVAFGKTAELDGVADFNFKIQSLAGYLTPSLESGTDFDDLFVPNTYILKNVTKGQYVNSPIESGTGTLEIKSGGEEGQVHQIVTVCSKVNPIRYERHYYGSTWGDWIVTWYNGNKVLWGGDMTSGMYMTEGHTIELNEAISAQRNGIVLVFSAYNGTDDTNYAWQTFFVPKYLVSASTSGHTFMLSRGKFTYVGTKYLYIRDTQISGHADNDATGTANGITYANNKFVLRYVIGV